jgi:hypothetical protein
MLHRDSNELLIGSVLFLIFCLLLTFVLPVWYQYSRRAEAGSFRKPRDLSRNQPSYVGLNPGSVAD